MKDIKKLEGIIVTESFKGEILISRRHKDNFQTQKEETIIFVQKMISDRKMRKMKYFLRYY